MVMITRPAFTERALSGRWGSAPEPDALQVNARTATMYDQNVGSARKKDVRALIDRVRRIPDQNVMNTRPATAYDQNVGSAQKRDVRALSGLNPARIVHTQSLTDHNPARSTHNPPRIDHNPARNDHTPGLTDHNPDRSAPRQGLIDHKATAQPPRAPGQRHAAAPRTNPKVEPANHTSPYTKKTSPCDSTSLLHMQVSVLDARPTST